MENNAFAYHPADLNMMSAPAAESDVEKIYCQYCELEFTDFDLWRAHEEEESRMYEASEVMANPNPINYQQIPERYQERQNQQIPERYQERQNFQQNQPVGYPQPNLQVNQAQANIQEKKKEGGINLPEQFLSKYKNIVLTKVEKPPTANQNNVANFASQNGVKSNPFHCAQCPFTYDSKEALQRHLKFHSTGGPPHTMTPNQINVLNMYFQQLAGLPSKEMMPEISQATQIDSHAYIESWFKSKIRSLPRKRPVDNPPHFSQENNKRPNQNSYEFNYNNRNANQSGQDYNKDKRISGRSKYSEEQQAILFSYFDKLGGGTEVLTRSTANEISELTDIPPNSITLWFQYQRKQKRENPQAEMRPDGRTQTPSPSGSQNVQKNPELSEEVKKIDNLQAQFDFLVKQVGELKKEFDESKKSLDDFVAEFEVKKESEEAAQNIKKEFVDNYSQPMSMPPMSSMPFNPYMPNMANFNPYYGNMPRPPFQPPTADGKPPTNPYPMPGMPFNPPRQM